MTIKKFQGKTKEEAIALAKEEMGSSVVIMNVKEVRQEGIFGIFKGSMYEVTVALEDDVMPQRPFSIPQPQKESNTSGFNAVADEEISLRDLTKDVEPVAVSPVKNTAPVSQELHAESQALKEAFAAVNEVMEKNGHKPIAPLKESQAAQMVKEPEFRPLQSMDFVEEIPQERDEQSHQFFKILYKVLLDNEVDEVYINQFMDELDRVSHSTNGLDYLISNVYQKMILKLGQPEVISLSKKKPKVVFFIGPTGVGKTTTIAKIASRFKVEQEKKVALLTADTYRIAAAEQLRTYANILDTPLSIIYTPEDIGKEMEKFLDYDLVLVDTAGFSHKNDGQREDMKRLLENLPAQYERQIYLVLSATTKYKDLIEITDIYNEFCEFHLIFTKLDETSTYGNILNIKLHTGAQLSYVTTGQNVPDDIEVVDTQKLVKQLLGGR